MPIKHRPTDLAIFGGPPLFAEPLHVGRPNLGSRQQLDGLIDSIFSRRWLTNAGPLVRQFEERVAQVAGTAHCVAVCNATVGLQVLAKALGITGEVVVPAFTFVATAHALAWLGLTPVFADIDPGTHNLDASAVDQLCGPHTGAILALHCWGRPCPIDRLTTIAKNYGVPLFFDAAHAFGCTFGQRPVGSFGAAEVFSFHATKFVNTCEGGAITTNDAHLAAELRLLINFGFTGYDQVATLGTNAKLSELHAAMGLVSLDNMDHFIETNRRNYNLYRQFLSHCRGLALLSYPSEERSNFQYVVVEVDQAATLLSRDLLVKTLHAEGILARRYFFPGCHRMAPYHGSPKHLPRPVPHTDALCQRTLLLPTGTAVDESEIFRICALLHFLLDHAEEIAAMSQRQGVDQSL